MVHDLVRYMKKKKFLNLFISTDALRASGGSSAHHQEDITVHRASVLSNTTAASCCHG